MPMRPGIHHICFTDGSNANAGLLPFGKKAFPFASLEQSSKPVTDDLSADGPKAVEMLKKMWEEA